MSVGVFLGIGASFRAESGTQARAYLNAVNRALQHAGLPPYDEPPLRGLPTVASVGLGRSADDHLSAAAFALLANFASGWHSSQLELLQRNPHRVAFVPTDFAEPMITDYSETISGVVQRIWVGSAPALLRELRSIAPELGVPLDGGELSADIAGRINVGEVLYPSDPGILVEVERPAWLLLYEGARLAIVHGVALSLAG